MHYYIGRIRNVHHFFIVDNLGFQLDAPNSENRSVPAENAVWRRAPPTQHQIENPTLK